MKFVAMGDLHVTNKKPKLRKDEDYLLTIIQKLDQIYEFACQNDAKVVVQPGDFFDSAKASDYLKQLMVIKLKEYQQKYGITTLTIFGQHDLRFHSSDIKNTPLAVLEAAGVLTILDNQIPTTIGDVNFYGSSWNEEPASPSKDKCNVLVTHKMIVKSKIWEGQEDFIYGPNMFRKHPAYTYFITGDNHQSFSYTVKPTNKSQRSLLNCGSLMRSNIRQIDHHPCCYIIDTDFNICTEHNLKVKDIDDVLDLEASTLKKKEDEDLEKFIQAMKIQAREPTISMNFIANLKDKMKEQPQELQDEIAHILTIVEKTEGE